MKHQNSYSIFIAYIAIFFAIYLLIVLFLSSSILTIPLILSLGISIRCLYSGVYSVYKRFITNKDGYISIFGKFFLITNSSILFIASSFGLIRFIDSFDLPDNSQLYILTSISLLLFLGASIGLYQPIE